MTTVLSTVRPATRLRPPGPGTGPAGPAGRRPPGQGGAARDAGARLRSMTSGFVGLFLEVEAGRRPRAQLRPLMTPMLYARLAEIWVRGGTPGVVESVRVAAQAGDRADVVAIVRRGHRWGAVSVGVVRTASGWLVDTVARPEDGSLPPPAYPVPCEEPSDDVEELPPLPVAATPAVAGDWAPHT
jgi:hypothetical protein